MASHTKLLDQVSRLADEHAIDAVYVIRRKQFHWPVVIGGLVLGAVAGLLMPHGWWFWAPSLAFVGMGFGMNVTTDFRLLARTASRVLLLDASRVNAKPTRVATGVGTGQVEVLPRVLWADVTIRAEAHVMARHQVARLERMLHG